MEAGKCMSFVQRPCVLYSVEWTVLAVVYWRLACERPTLSDATSVTWNKSRGILHVADLFIIPPPRFGFSQFNPRPLLTIYTRVAVFSLFRATSGARRLDRAPLVGDHCRRASVRLVLLLGFDRHERQGMREKPTTCVL